MKNFAILEKSLGFEFKNRDLLIEAFCHRSYLNEHPDFPLPHNERLEFLGDAVLELIVTEYLYKKYPEKNEGGINKLEGGIGQCKNFGRIGKRSWF